jgi:hypothetical protein
MAEKLMTTGNPVTGSLVEKIRRCRKVMTSKGQGLPMFIFGSPGVGKSEQVHQACDHDNGDTMIDLRLNTLDSIDLRGLPVVKKGVNGEPTQVEWVRPEFIPWEGRGILFLDEMNTAPPSVQNPALQLVLDRRVGNHKLGKDWYIVAAGNKSDDRAHVHPLSAALRQRFAIYHYEPDKDTWTNWAIRNGIHPNVIGFISFKPDQLITPPIDDEGANPSPRSWYYVSQRLFADQNELDDIRSVVGPAANEFMAYQNVCSHIPSITEIISGKTSFKEDNKNVTMSYAISSALGIHLLRAGQKSQQSKQFVNEVNNCFKNAVNNMAGEPGMVFMRYCLIQGDEKLRNVICSCDEGKKWFDKHGDHLQRAISM